MPRASSRPGRAPRPEPAAGRGRLLIFAAVCAVSVLAVAGYALIAAQRSNLSASGPASDTPAAPDVLASVASRPHLVFLHSPSGDAYRRVAMVPLDAPDGPRYLTPLQCQRVYFAAGEGLCLGNNYVGGVASAYNAYSFDDQFQIQATYDQPGVPIRVRLSADGLLGAMTVFVTGHSYADIAFSTQTNLVDTRSGQMLMDLEKMTLERDGAPFRSVDFNFWGVTFARDKQHFYATLGTGGKTYLIEGNSTTLQGRVLAENVECPSLSPDNTRLAFKQRKSNDNRTWHLAVLDLTTMTVSQVPNESRSVDDQVEWLDDTHILYGMRAEGSIATDIWESSIDSSEQPRIFVHQALSPTVVR